MNNHLKTSLEAGPCVASAPCRVDLGGTLDIKTLYLPMACFSPSTFNMAIDLRTTVTLRPYQPGRIKISSRGFEDVEFALREASFDHPLGLMTAIAAHFDADGVHINIDSKSPPRSALGGSSAAAVALTAALAKACGIADAFPKARLVMTAHGIEEGVARIPCGLQDQLAAAFGGVNTWYWKNPDAGDICFEQRPVLDGDRLSAFESCFLVAYCGMPHESKNINGKWVDHFIRAQDRGLWREIIDCSNGFTEALAEGDLERAAGWMNQEVAARRRMTPDVLDETGNRLVDCAAETRCGGRFTGAGGGGCVWAIGVPEHITMLREKWQAILKTRQGACLLAAGIDRRGIVVE
ncbi:MAG: galactokinase [Thermodesulfobacteriota bacterium]